ncbi:MAG: AMP-binding protein [Clostridia bacterium]|nr:AMP-binding protein [Clostridia bacterium]
MKNVILPILKNAQINGTKAAIVDCSGGVNKNYSYLTLVRHVEAFAKELKRQGYGKGDRIIVFIPMSYETYVAVLSVLYIGAVAVFIDAWVDGERLSDSIGITNPTAAIISNKLGKSYSIPDYVKQIDCSMMCCSRLTKSDDLLLLENMEDEDEAIFTFTTGSTGIPKAARRTHGFFMIQHQILSKYLGHKPDEINMVTFPIFLLSNLLSGITSVIPSFNPAEPSNVDCGWVSLNVRSLGVNSMTGSTALFEKLSSYIMSGGEKISLRQITIGGSPVFPSIAEKLCKAFLGTDIRVIYGATEAVPISMNSMENIYRANMANGLPVGKIVDEIYLKVIKPYDGAIKVDNEEHLDSYTVRNGEVGEIIVAGPHVLKGYVNNQEADRINKIFDGERLWHRTGDAGSTDGQGNLTFFGRVKNRICVKEKVIYPLPVENILLGVEDIGFAAVIQLGEKIMAVLELLKNQEIFQDGIMEKIKKLDIGYIDEFFVMDKIPRDPRHNSKANYEELKKYFSKAENSLTGT